MTTDTGRERWLRGLGLTALAAVLTMGFLAYLRPAFMVDLTNMVLAWCG
ncbi:hypothetical protein [Cupriavidus pampae]|uniref:Uncharacterized protein n=1 Tax=Cupriavidus pampae TaxID=659251 RepID=A0ABN7YVL6_9BURK|nr:hypothetical protein [Cupriavidus pampae]CAG9176386.1 hypothetical protein LMG32289_03515 [Cupriavidus pampae]